MTYVFRSKNLVAALTLAVLAVGRLAAQEQPDPNLKPTYGAVKLDAGFLPDPFTKEVQAGGKLRTNLGGVNAYVAKAPDFSLQYTAGKYPLTFSAKSVGDTTLLINLPDGSWIADDDSGGGLDPLIRIAQPKSGRYDIYVGTFQKDIVAATLYITELEAAKKPAPPFNPNLPECFIISAGVDNYRTQKKLNGCLNDARNTVAAFQAQTGTVFRSVKERVLLDDSASHGAISKAFRNLTTQGAAGDYMVLFLSGHGARTDGNKGNTWFFLPVDFHPPAVRQHGPNGQTNPRHRRPARPPAEKRGHHHRRLLRRPGQRERSALFATLPKRETRRHGADALQLTQPGKHGAR